MNTPTTISLTSSAGSYQASENDDPADGLDAIADQIQHCADILSSGKNRDFSYGPRSSLEPHIFTCFYLLTSVIAALVIYLLYDEFSMFPYVLVLFLFQIYVSGAQTIRLIKSSSYKSIIKALAFATALKFLAVLSFGVWVIAACSIDDCDALDIEGGLSVTSTFIFICNVLTTCYFFLRFNPRKFRFKLKKITTLRCSSDMRPHSMRKTKLLVPDPIIFVYDLTVHGHKVDGRPIESTEIRVNASILCELLSPQRFDINVSDDVMRERLSKMIASIQHVNFDSFSSRNPLQLECTKRIAFAHFKHLQQVVTESGMDF